MILDSFALDGKVALVTGASRGLGQAMAIALAEAGASVALVASKPCTETAAAITALGRHTITLEANLMHGSPADYDALIETVVGRLGRVDILVNNAGIIRRRAAADIAEQDWNDVIAINQSAVFFLAQAAGRRMIAQRSGKIINTASLLSLQGGINVASYTASKSAVAGITRALANEWAATGVQVNAIVPGYFATDNTAALREDEARSAAILDRIPAGRWGLPADLQGAVVFLASSASDYVTGHLLAVDGGWLAR